MAIATTTNSSSSIGRHGREAPLIPTSGRELLLDLKRSTAQNASAMRSGAAPTLPAYNHKLVQACLRDLHATARELDLQARVHGSQAGDGTETENGSGKPRKPSMPARPSILLHHRTIQRQKQCLLAYHHHRTEILKAIERSRMAANEEAPVGGPGASSHAGEAAFARDYAALRRAYSDRVFELDALPPTSHMVQVRVVAPSSGRTGSGDGDLVVLPDSGRVVSLAKGARLFLDRSDARDFLRQGIVELCDGEEVDF